MNTTAASLQPADNAQTAAASAAAPLQPSAAQIEDTTYPLLNSSSKATAVYAEPAPLPDYVVRSWLWSLAAVPLLLAVYIATVRRTSAATTTETGEQR